MEINGEFESKSEYKCIFDINPERQYLHLAVDDNSRVQRQIDEGMPQINDKQYMKYKMENGTSNKSKRPLVECFNKLSLGNSGPSSPKTRHSPTKISGLDANRFLK